MMNHIKQIRKSLTLIELEAGVKHPERPDFRLMKREIEEIDYLAAKLRWDLAELMPMEF